MASPPTQLTKELNDALHKASNNRAIRYLDTASAYDLWAEVYDTDGNFLQALDNIEMQTLLPKAISLLASHDPSLDGTNSATKLKAVDLGCGTGRNTLNLLNYQNISEVVAIDLSPKMLEVAKQRCTQKFSDSPVTVAPKLTFETYDMVSTPTPPQVTVTPPADLVISTLVLEHVPLPVFFATASRMLVSGGILLMTNMHSEMGNISQAGFVDPKTGDKIRPTSYAHTVEDTRREAAKWELEIIEVENEVGLKEVKMTQDLIGKLGVRSEKWVGIDVWFGGIWRKS